MIRRTASRLLAVIVGGFLLGLALGLVRGQAAPAVPPVVEPADAPTRDDEAPCPQPVTTARPPTCGAADGLVFLV